MPSTSRHAVFSSLLSVVALALLSLVPLSSAQSVMNFCYYMQQDAVGIPAWNISVSGSMTVTGPVTTSGQAVYTVVGITGVRTQTGTGASTVYITGLAINATAYDNTLSTQWPFLKGGTASGGAGVPQTLGGIGYTVSSPVTVPAPGATPTSVINIVSHPVNEQPLYSVSNTNQANGASGLTGLSYFVYQPASAGVPNCNPSAAVRYSFYYSVTPTYNATSTAYTYGDWSACVTGNLSVLGPFSIPSYAGTGLNNVLVVVGATGSRYITATRGFTAQTTTITGVGPDDGGDFMIYGYGPVVSDAGITFRYNTAPTIITRNGAENGNSAFNYLNVWSTAYNNYQVNEANVNVGQVDQFVSLQFPQPVGTNPLIDNYVCPPTVLTQEFGFCYYGEAVGGPSIWTVSMAGTLLAAPEVSGSGHWFITSAVGTRVQTSNNAVVSTVNVTGLGGLTVDASTSTGSLDNQFSSSYPFLSNHGIAFTLSSPVTPPAPAGGSAPAATSTTYLINDPPCELGTCTTGQYSQGWSMFLLYPAQFGGAFCGTPGTPGGLPTFSLNFGYIATPRTGPALTSNTNAAQPTYFNTATAPSGKGCTSTYQSSNNLACPVWSSCVSANLTAVGPLYLPGPTTSSNVAYAFAIYGATGNRYYYDVTGATQTAAITGVVYQDGADQVLYFGSPYVDDAGISFATSAAPTLAFPNTEGGSGALEPGQTQLTYINLWSAQQGGTTYGVTATEATLTTYPDNTAQIYWGVSAATTRWGVTLPVQAPFTCPAPAYTVLNFCVFVSALPGTSLASNTQAVSYSGQFIAQPASPTSSNWIVSGITGTRSTYATSPYGNGGAVAQTATSTQLLSSLNSGDGNNAMGNQQLGQQYPILSGGINMVVTSYTGNTATGSQQILLNNNPPSESIESWSATDTGYVIYTAAGDTSITSCPPTNTKTLSFSYTAKPATSPDDTNQAYNTNPSTGAQWSSCMTGLLQVIGPYTFPAANGLANSTAYVVLGATGARTFVDVNGTAWTTWITGLNNGVGGGSSADGADMLLYTAAPYVDNAGITFDLSGPPRWPNSANPSAAVGLQQFDYINLWHQGFADWNGPTEAIPPYTPYNYVTMSFSSYSSGASLYQCPQGPNLNNIPLTFGTGPSSNAGTNGGSSSSPDHTLSNGQVAGIAVGVTLAFIILIALAVCLTLSLAGGRKSSNTAGPNYGTDNSKVVNNASHVQMEESRNAETAP